MYVVISKWEFDPGNETLVSEKGQWLLSQIRSWDGVELAFNVRTNPGSFIAVIGYRDPDTRKVLIQAEDSPFEQALAQSGLLEFATWKWTEEGESL